MYDVIILKGYDIILNLFHCCDVEFAGKKKKSLRKLQSWNRSEENQTQTTRQ